MHSHYGVAGRPDAPKGRCENILSSCIRAAGPYVSILGTCFGRPRFRSTPVSVDRTLHGQKLMDGRQHYRHDGMATNAIAGNAMATGAMKDEIASLSSVRDLLEAVQRGSRAALQRLYELESRRLYGVALRIVRRPEIAADALQDAFIQVWQNARSFSAERGDGSAWLVSIVRYRALDAVRKLRREVLSGDPALGDRAEEPDIVEQIDLKVAEAALRRCLGLLEEPQRRCVALAFVDGLSHAEIAVEISAPLGSVKSWIRRGLLSLRGCLEP
jgi:RNA polymerase sigma-70 factor (ECF subfamily)